MFDLVAMAVPVWVALGALTFAVLFLMGIVLRLVRHQRLLENTLTLHMREAGAHSLFEKRPRR